MSSGIAASCTPSENFYSQGRAAISQVAVTPLFQGSHRRNAALAGYTSLASSGAFGPSGEWRSAVLQLRPRSRRAARETAMLSERRRRHPVVGHPCNTKARSEDMRCRRDRDGRRDRGGPRSWHSPRPRSNGKGHYSPSRRGRASAWRRRRRPGARRSGACASRAPVVACQHLPLVTETRRLLCSSLDG